MIRLELSSSRALAFKSVEPVYAGERNITDVEIELPENFGEYSAENCELTLYAVLEDGSYFSYPIDGSRILVSSDLTEKAQTLRFYIKITSHGDVIGLTNAVALKVGKSPEGHTRLYPRAQLDAIIARLESENMALSGDIERLESELTQMDSDISSLNSRITQLTEENTSLTADNVQKGTTILNLSENLNPNRFQAKTATPSARAQLITPDSGYLGLSAVMVDGISAETIPNLVSENIRHGVSVLGVEGSFTSLPSDPAGGVYFSEPNLDNKPTKARVASYPLPASANFPNLFFNQNALTEIEFFNCNHIERLCETIFMNCTSLQAITLPPALVDVPSRMFYSCRTIENITLPDTVTEIGTNAFGACIALKNINMPRALQSIGSNAFFDCSALTTLTFSEGLTNIASFAFSQSGMTHMALPNSITTIGTYILVNCTSFALLDLTALDHVPVTGSAILGNVHPSCKIIVADEDMKSVFTSATNWSYYADKMMTREEYENADS